MTIITVKTGGIAADAVTDAKIADDVVGTEHLTANEVDTAALKADAVTGAELADNAVNSEHYTDGSIDTAHIADDQITSAKLGTGDMTFPNGNLVFGTAGKGVYLGVTSATAANLLDDYEEGTWTPAMDGMSQSNESGHYTKVGNLCTAKFKISPGGSGNNVSITGFPFTSQAGFEQNGWARETESAGNYWAIRLSGGAVAATIIRYDANVSVDTGDTFEGSITYITNT
jgi:hypothetical protein